MAREPLIVRDRLQMYLGIAVGIVWVFLHIIYALKTDPRPFPDQVDYIMGIVTGGLFAPAIIGRWRTVPDAKKSDDEGVHNGR